MPKTYRPEDLEPIDLASSAWALAYVRLALRDKPNELGAWPVRGFTDEELLVELELAAVTTVTPTGQSVRLYTPHRVAAHLVLANPEYVQSYSGGGFGEKYRSAEEIAAGILAKGAALERLLPGVGAQPNAVELGW